MRKTLRTCGLLLLFVIAAFLCYIAYLYLAPLPLNEIDTAAQSSTRNEISGTLQTPKVDTSYVRRYESRLSMPKIKFSNVVIDPDAYRLPPPFERSFLEIQTQLKADSKSGIARATCQIGWEILQCQHFINSGSFQEQLEEINTPRKYSQAEKTGMIKGLNAINARCSGLDHKSLLNEEPWRYTLHAAMQGHTDSMYRFALVPPTMGSAESVLATFLDPEWVSAYRTYAPALLQEAVNQGHISAIGGLIELQVGDSYLTGFPGAPRAAPRDEKMALNYAFALEAMPDVNTLGRYFRERKIAARVIAQVGPTLSTAEVSSAKVWGKEFALRANAAQTRQSYKGEIPLKTKDGLSNAGICYE
jgi:hypothetical protein